MIDPGGSSSSAVQGNILNLCKHSARSIADLAFGGNLLNHIELQSQRVHTSSAELQLLRLTISHQI